jgi:hypothetical protein
MTILVEFVSSSSLSHLHPLRPGQLDTKRVLRHAARNPSRATVRVSPFTPTRIPPANFIPDQPPSVILTLTPRSTQGERNMATVIHYRCEICGTESSNPVHWFLIQCNAEDLKISKWNTAAAALPGARHYCGEAHASVYVSRWLEASCTPSLTDFNRASAGS